MGIIVGVSRGEEKKSKHAVTGETFDKNGDDVSQGVDGTRRRADALMWESLEHLELEVGKIVRMEEKRKVEVCGGFIYANRPNIMY